MGNAWFVCVSLYMYKALMSLISLLQNYVDWSFML